MEDVLVLASHAGHKQPSFYGKFQDFNRESWIGKEMVQMIKDTKSLGPIKWRD